MGFIKLFEDFMGSDDGAFRADIRRDRISFSLYEAPAELKHGLVIDGHIEWRLPVHLRDWGIELADTATIESMYFTVEVEDEDGGYVYRDISAPEGALREDQFSTEFRDIGDGKIALLGVEITMGYSMDPRDWRIEMEIGSRSHD